MDLCLNPYFGETDLANVLGTVFVLVSPSFLRREITFADFAFPVILWFATRFPDED